MNIIVPETNCYADKYLQNKYPREETHKKYSWIPVTVDEMWIFLEYLSIKSL